VIQIFYLPSSLVIFEKENHIRPSFEHRPSPPWQHELLAEITVLRI
jgi:hypothetical protein